MKEQSNIEKTVIRSQFCSVNNHSLLTPTHVKPINKLCLSPSWKNFQCVLQRRMNYVIQGHRPFVMQAELGVVRLQQCVTSLTLISPQEMETFISVGNTDVILPNPHSIHKISTQKFSTELFMGKAKNNLIN